VAPIDTKTGGQNIGGKNFLGHFSFAIAPRILGHWKLGISLEFGHCSLLICFTSPKESLARWRANAYFPGSEMMQQPY
jgi:hypothetical protein